jgi:hypothetical protein
MQSLADLARDTGDCVLCGQPESSTAAEEVFAPDDEDTGQLSLYQQWTVNDERRRIQAMIEEVKELAAEAHPQQLQRTQN